jgi:hypothetical protein
MPYYLRVAFHTGFPVSNADFQEKAVEKTHLTPLKPPLTLQ